MYTLEEGKDYIVDDEEQLPYIHIKRLGIGHSGLVEKVRDQNTDRIFARKTILFSVRAKEDMMNIFKNEVALIRRLSGHHHFVRVYTTYMAKLEFGIILEPVADGGDLSQYLRIYHDLRDGTHESNSTASSSELLSMRSVMERAFGCLTNGLCFMHAKKVRHKDIKPQNILVHQGKLIFTDFGYSLDTSRLTTSVSEGPPKFWTLRYAAPEVIAYEERDSRSDVWSLGCVLIDIFAALTELIKINVDEDFSKAMDDLHESLLGLPMTGDYNLLPRILINMTALEASQRSSSKDLAARISVQPTLSCRDCRSHPAGVDSIGLHEGSIRNRPPSEGEAEAGPVRNNLLYFLGGTPGEGGNDRLDSSYRIRAGAEAKDFFTHGRVFAMLYSQAVSATARYALDDAAFTVVRYGEKVWSRIRRFVVVSVRRNFVLACAMNTYGNRETLEQGCFPAEHAIAYSTGSSPVALDGEREAGLVKEPIEIAPSIERDVRLEPACRIQFGRVYPIEWSLEVKDLGRVVLRDRSLLTAHYKEEELRWASAAE